MEHQQETPERKRERLRQEELKNNPIGAFGDGLNRAESGNLADLIGGMGWKGTGILILIIILGYLLYKFLF